MITVGVTGGIGSGKTIVCNIFRQLTVPVFNSDEEAKKFYDSPEIKEIIKNTFGEKYIVNDKLDKKSFASLIFTDQSALKKINSIIHPLVKKQFRDWKKTFRDHPYVIKEAAILFESGTFRDCDKTITVTAPRELCIERIKERDNRSREEILKIINSQWSEEEKEKHSTFVIVNDDMHLVLTQVLAIHKKLVE